MPASTIVFATLAGLALAGLPAPAFARATAHSSGAQNVYAGPGTGYPIIDQLRNRENVYVTSCTWHAHWCEIVQLDGGPPGWVQGSYLVGEAAKNAVTPFDFGFNPLDPVPGFGRRGPRP